MYFYGFGVAAVPVPASAQPAGHDDPAEDAQLEFGAGGGVRRVGGRKFQVGGVLDGDDVFVGNRGIGVLHAGRLLWRRSGRIAAWWCWRKRAAHGGEGRRVGIRPAPEFQRRQVRGQLNGGENGVGTAQHGVQFVRVVEADLKFLMQFHV